MLIKTLEENLRYFVKYKLKSQVLTVKSIVDGMRMDEDCRMQQYPTEIQLPITYKCNYNCVMCGMRNLINKDDFSYEDLEKILSNKLFSKVEAVGVNGGEPLLKSDLYQCFEVMIKTLPKLKAFNMISNGYFTNKYRDEVLKIKQLCSENGIKLNLTISVDGIGNIQDLHRGHTGAWQHVQDTFDLILKDRERYCDGLNIICTITKYNIDSINEVDVWADYINVPVAYNIATVNVRINNLDRVEDFTIFNDEHARQMAEEFFYVLFTKTTSKRYFAIYYYIKSRERIAPCPCRNNSWVTLTPNMQLGYCATHSNELGNALEKSAYELFQGNLSHLDDIKAQYCEHCSHYMYTLNRKGKKAYYSELKRILKF